MRTTKRYIYWTIYAILYCSLFKRYIWDNQLCLLIPDLIILGICIFKNGLTNKIAKKNSINKSLGNSIIFLYISFFIVGFISDIINIVNPLSAIWGIKMILRYAFLFLLVYKNFDTKDIIKIRKIINTSFYINALFILFQFFTNVRGDRMGGIWNGNGGLTLYILLLTTLFSTDYFQNKLSLRQYIVKVCFFFIIAMWAEIKMLYFLIPICVYGSYILFKNLSAKLIIVLSISCFLAIPVLNQVLSLYYDEDYISQTLDTEKLQEYNNNNYGFTEESINRGTIFEKSIIFMESPKDIIIGHGLGSGNISQNFKTKIYEEYRNTFYHYFTMSYLLIEVGFLGLFIFLIAHFLLLYRFLYIYIKFKDYVLKYWSALGILSTFIAFIMIYYNSVPISNYYLGYLFWAICCIAIRERQKQLILNKHDS